MRTVDQMLTEPMDPADKILMGLNWGAAFGSALISEHLHRLTVPWILALLSFHLLASFLNAFTGNRFMQWVLLASVTLSNASGLYAMGVLHGRAESSQGISPVSSGPIHTESGPTAGSTLR